MNRNDEYVVKIEKMLYEGKSLARIENFPVFIDNACPDDEVLIKIVKVNKNYAIGEIKEIITPSQFRIKPKCPLSNVCGSCSQQYIAYEKQLTEKQNIVKETIKNITGIDCEVEEMQAAPQIFEYRCKVQYPVSQTKVSKRLLAGYYKKNSHELINIKYCPSHSPLISEILDFFRKNATKYKITGYNEKNNTGLVRHIIFRKSANSNKILIVFVINNSSTPTALKKISKDIVEKYQDIVGVCVNFNAKKTNVILGEKTETIFGNDYYIEELGGYKYKISANSFFQVNPYCAELIFDKVKEIIAERVENPLILDAYSGVSSFGIWLSDIAKNVVCVEEVESSSLDALENIKLNNIKNIEIINGDAGEKFAELIKNNVQFDVAITDPPRKGCSDDSLQNLVQLTKKYIIYVSCNVSTLARDMKKLSQYGFMPVYIKPFDMFPNTYHIETLVLFERKNQF